ncbi:peptide chain release factor N(5)-glutamine methyltransferase [bacterium]|jgi:release factor glutamine methyltransferase|nr:peptide chain release factor N(5)-glutamine methyltransferase [bacterium]
MSTLSALWNWGTKTLLNAGIDTAQLDAQFILEHACGMSLTQLTQNLDATVEVPTKDQFKSLIKQRSLRLPIAQLIGKWPFRAHDYWIENQVLVPRPETEHLIDHAITLINLNQTQSPLIIECGSGSGIIPCELAFAFPKAQIHTWDISPTAIHATRKNCDYHGLHSISISEGDFFESSKKIQSMIKTSDSLPLVISNPPYIPHHEIETLMPEVKNHDPHIALDGGVDGLDFYRQFITLLSGHNSLFLAEIGSDQKPALIDLIQSHSHTISDYQFHEDYQGHPRCLMIRFHASPPLF